MSNTVTLKLERSRAAALVNAASFRARHSDASGYWENVADAARSELHD